MAFLSSLQLPSATQVCVNLPKNLLKKHGFAESLLDDIVVQSGKTQCFDRAIIAPRTCAIPSYVDDTRLYDEIHVLEIAVSQRKNLDKLEEALFRAIPYALILIARHDAAERISLAHFRTNAADKSLNVLTDIIHSRWFDANAPLPCPSPTPHCPKTTSMPFTAPSLTLSSWTTSARCGRKSRRRPHVRLPSSNNTTNSTGSAKNYKAASKKAICHLRKNACIQRRYR